MIITEFETAIVKIAVGTRVAKTLSFFCIGIPHSCTEVPILHFGMPAPNLWDFYESGRISIIG